jgi:ferredoxin
MRRQIIKIDKEKCNGCGACAQACHEGAIGMIDGKAELLRDDYCDGLGNCLPVCPTGAITFEEREAAAFDEAAVLENKQKNEAPELPCGCPGTLSKSIDRAQDSVSPSAASCSCSESSCSCGEDSGSFDESPALSSMGSKLSQWPVQIKLVPINAPYFDNANLLVAADCTAYAYGNFHNQFIRNRITLIGCPKLDEGDYTEKLTEIIKNNNIKSLTVVRMEVPCCGGMEYAAKTALQRSGKFIPWQVVTISADGKILD